MLVVVSLGSGSSGNALLVRTSSVNVLVDCGVEVRALAAGLATHGLTFDQLDAVLVSHEHGDHCRTLPRIASTQLVAVGTPGTARSCGQTRRNWLLTTTARPTIVGDIEIFSIPVNHDAAEPCGFHLRTVEGSISVLTDLGSHSGATAEAIKDSDLIVLEANHDASMLRNGPYPAHLKRRIQSDSGHLSNTECGELLAAGLRNSTRVPTIWLAHLSQTNNRPKLARDTVTRRLARDGLALEVEPLPRRGLGPVWRPGQSYSRPVQLALSLDS